jgi:hypothetical protein
VTTSLESRLRQDLRDLADVPGPPSLVDRALADARRQRRRRVVVAGAGTLVIVALIAVPFVLRAAGVNLSLPFGEQPAGGQCGEATDEAEPPDSVPVPEQPRFVRVVQGKLPPRSDYYLQYATGMCVAGEEPTGLAGERLHGYAVINIGQRQEHGHLTVTIQHQTMPTNCNDIPTPEMPWGNKVCEDATATTPLVMVVEDRAERQFSVTAVYPGNRVVSMDSFRTPFDVDTIRAIVTDPDLVALLGGPV